MEENLSDFIDYLNSKDILVATASACSSNGKKRCLLRRGSPTKTFWRGTDSPSKNGTIKSDLPNRPESNCIKPVRSGISHRIPLLSLRFCAGRSVWLKRSVSYHEIRHRTDKTHCLLPRSACIKRH